MSPMIEQLSGSANITMNQDNIMVLEIDNLLSNWPTYVIDYTPEHPGPLKIILRLKDVRKHVIADDDKTITSESDLEDQKAASAAVLIKQRIKGASISLQLYSSDENGKDEDSSEDDKTLTVDATPVAFHGILKDKIPVKPKFFNSDETIWPPVRPRSLRPISSNEPVSKFMFLRTFPALVKVIDDKQDH